jgi:hypothetical protein
MKFDETWQQVGGSPGETINAGTYTPIFITDVGTRYVAYADATIGDGYATVKWFDGINWQSVGSAGFSNSTVLYTNLFIYDGIPYVGYHDRYNNNGYASVMKYDCTTGSGKRMGLLSVSKSTPTPIMETKFDESSVYNYPNPSSGVTTIRFAIPEAQDVYVFIYDINGKQIWTKFISKDDTARGLNKILWDGKNDMGVSVANGIYIYRVAIKTEAITKKIAIIR